LIPVHKSLLNTIDYIEMPSRDLAGTKDFFTQLFGWSFQDYGPDYCACDDGRMTGGFFASKSTGSVAAGAPLIVFYHSDLEKICAEVARLGGKITREIFDFPGGRRFHFEAPGSSEFAIWSE
jgi:predicted enzyme related to lactoylglutathione lyase